MSERNNSTHALIALAWLAVGRISRKNGCGRLAAIAKVKADRSLGKPRARRQTRSDLY